jgi:hypothetical protein
MGAHSDQSEIRIQILYVEAINGTPGEVTPGPVLRVPSSNGRARRKDRDGEWN